MIALAMLISATALQPPQAAAEPLDFLVGDWTIHDETGRAVGTAHVEAQVPGSMLLETRRVDGEPQPLWWENSERDGGWIQLFVGPTGRVRAFTPISRRGEWPLVIGADVIRRDGSPARFRVTMKRPSATTSWRRLDMSLDGGRTWQKVFNYEYRRAAP